MNQSEYVLRQRWISDFDLVIETDLFLFMYPGVNLFKINAPAYTINRWELFDKVISLLLLKEKIM